MKQSWKVLSALLVSVVAAAVLVPTVLARSERQIRLKPTAAYSGARATAQYQKGSRHREFQLEIRHIGSLAGKRVIVYVSGTKIGAPRVQRRGAAELNRSTDHRQRVPKVRAGTMVKVRAPGGALIASGRFGSAASHQDRQPSSIG